MKMKPKRLTREQFLEVLDRTPLVSIDLVVKDPENRILLGLRVNEPAKGKWFVPGGRIMKDESIEEAFERISEDEIGARHSLSEARLIGAFTHHYDNNVFLRNGITTQYIALAYELPVKDDKKPESKSQHSEYEWASLDDVLPSGGNKPKYEVHHNTLAYFIKPQ
jgi:colanic acid biosynthesis protein WcaH